MFGLCIGFYVIAIAKRNEMNTNAKINRKSDMYTIQMVLILSAVFSSSSSPFYFCKQTDDL